MTNKLAILFGLAIVLALALDYYYWEWGSTIFLGRKLIDLIEYLAFWR